MLQPFERTVSKASWEERAFGIDFSAQVPSGEAVSTVSCLIYNSADEEQSAMHPASVSISGNIATQKVVGGADGEDYTIILRATTDGGTKLEAFILLLVRDATNEVLTTGWASIEEANDYFRFRLGASTYWHPESEKGAALVTAYEQLVACGRFTFPTTATSEMKKMQFEQALFLLMNAGGNDQRAGLQAMGVVSAGIVKESYRDTGNEIALAPMAAQIGRELYHARSGFAAINLTRDEDEDVI